jgi:hypothetical protein
MNKVDGSVKAEVAQTERGLFGWADDYGRKGFSREISE